LIRRPTPHASLVLALLALSTGCGPQDDSGPAPGETAALAAGLREREAPLVTTTHLETRRMDLNKHLSLVNLLRNFHQTPIFSAFLELQHAVPAHAAEFPVGLVFPVPHIKFMVLHNRPSDFRPGATRIAITLNDGSTLTIEKLDDLLVAVGRPESWTTLQS
jgi:hypothetical protein